MDSRNCLAVVEAAHVRNVTRVVAKVLGWL